MSHDFYGDSGPIDLSNCHREPIHVPGAIQPHGVLLACSEPDLRILQASTTATETFGVPPEQLLGTRLSGLLGDGTEQRLRELLDGPRRILEPLRVDVEHGSFELTAHRSGEAVVVELERPRPVSARVEVRGSLDRLRHASGARELCQVAAQEVWSLSGFDRVMIYRFDEEWNGEVVAEARREDLAPYLGLHYPAADIPEQARRLYAINPIRLICDVGYEPSPLTPERDPTTDAPLDLSHAMLRSVSPIHLEYLRNMGVAASMSISILVGGRLWGLVACHHDAPHYPPNEVRWACELVGNNLAVLIHHAEQAEHHAQTARASRRCASIVARISSNQERLGALFEQREALLEAFDADALAVAEPGRVLRTADAPVSTRILALLDHLRPRLAEEQVIDTDQLSSAWPTGGLSGGVLAMDIDSGRGQALLLFRKPVVQTVTWGSHPDKTLTMVEGRPRLTPEGSFQLWKETVHDRCRPFLGWHAEAATQLRQGLFELDSQRAAALQRDNEALRHASEAQAQFLAMLSHELRNPLNAIVGWSRLLSGEALDAEQVDHAISVISRNAEVQVQLVDDLLDVSRIVNGKMNLERRPVDLVEVTRAAVDTLQAAIDARRVQVEVHGHAEEVMVAGDPDRLQQVAWNLLSNAIKFSARGGRIELSVRAEPTPELRVRDHGVGLSDSELPFVFERFRQVGPRRRDGLGLGLAVVKGIVELHGGSVRAHSEGKGRGSTFVVELPSASPHAGARRPRARPGLDTAVHLAPLSDRRILCADDDDDAIDLLRVMLERAGATVRAVEDADGLLEAVRSERFDAIVADLDLDDDELLALTGAIRDSEGHREVPLVSLTARTSADQAERARDLGFSHHQAKPVDAFALLSLLAGLTDED